MSREPPDNGRVVFTLVATIKCISLPIRRTGSVRCGVKPIIAVSVRHRRGCHVRAHHQRTGGITPACPPRRAQQPKGIADEHDRRKAEQQYVATLRTITEHEPTIMHASREQRGVTH